MKKYIISIVTILLISMMILGTVCKVQAVGLEVFDDPNPYVQESGDNSSLISFGNIVVWVVRTFGIAISALMLSIIGIKYIIGSVEEKAEYKQTMWPYVLGAVLILAGSSVANIIYQLMTGNS